MINLENVIKGLEICSEHGSWHGLDCEHNGAYKDCPYRGCETGCVVTIAKDALAILKTQEPVMLKNQHKPYGNSLNANAPWISRCPKCGKKIEDKQTRYCKYCGQAVRWE